MTMETPWSNCTHAVIVCGHAVFTGGYRCNVDEAADNKNWVLQSFQTGEGVFYLRHIKRGVELAANDTHALLLLSGGQSRADSQLSEAQSYLDAAQAHKFWGHTNVTLRCTTEEFARDSYENVLFGVARFHECTNRFPELITVVSWRFKERRFAHHAATMCWPMPRFAFEGVSNPQGDKLDSALVQEERTLESFQLDPMGYSRGGVLLSKKMSRNPFRRQHGYSVSCPAMSAMLSWDSSDLLPQKLVPWPIDNI